MTDLGEATPWAAMMRTAVALGVAPDGFWRLSLVEWRMLTETAVGTVALRRNDFERLMAAWPDGDME